MEEKRQTLCIAVMFTTYVHHIVHYKQESIPYLVAMYCIQVGSTTLCGIAQENSTVIC